MRERSYAVYMPASRRDRVTLSGVAVVIPANAGIQERPALERWIPAFAGMTGEGLEMMTGGALK
jgi:hypothetical protein